MGKKKQVSISITCALPPCASPFFRNLVLLLFAHTLGQRVSEFRSPFYLFNALSGDTCP